MLMDDDVIATLRVFWPHVARGGFYFVGGHDDHDVQKTNPLESKSFQLKSRRTKTSSSSSSSSSARVFEDYERTLSQKTQKMMAKVNFYEDVEPILSVFACARVCEPRESLRLGDRYLNELFETTKKRSDIQNIVGEDEGDFV